jgi:hypothetical protein
MNPPSPRPRMNVGAFGHEIVAPWPKTAAVRVEAGAGVGIDAAYPSMIDRRTSRPPRHGRPDVVGDSAVAG